MPVPTYDDLMLPLLQYAGDGEIHHVRDASEEIAKHLRLTEEQINELLPSGKKTKYYDRIHWAKTYLTKAHLLESAGRGFFQITERGFSVLNTKPTVINNEMLSQFPEFIEFYSPVLPEPTNSNKSVVGEQTPKEEIRSIYQRLRTTLIDELLDTIAGVSPTFFEKLVIDLLLKMGYGSSLDSGQHIGQSGDGGVDGVIREDKLGLDEIYLQAKRYSRDNAVDVKQIREFVGSLTSKGSTKGVFITTSYFTNSARDFVERIHTHRIILIDGQQLATLMIENNVGISVLEVFEIKQVDENYFPNQ